MAEEDLIELLEDQDVVTSADDGEGWTILVIDDDEEVHRATRFALRGVRILGRPLVLQHVHSAAQARALLPAIRDVAVILLDVVMETEDAGLALVDFIRRDCVLEESRIILRTGQPGYAPELTVFDRYDINDYRTKSELSRTRLITAISAAIRSYDQICTIAESRRGLEQIVKAAPDLLEQRALSSFAAGVLTQMAALLRVPIDGIVCAQRGSPFDQADSRMYVVGAAGKLSNHIAQPLETIHAPAMITAIEAAMERGENLFTARETVVFLRSGVRDAAVYVQTSRPLEALDRQLIEVFAANISACYSNLQLFEEINFTAYHDLLTGLANRARFILDLDELCAAAPQDSVLALLDINHFADLNDGLGHDVGNLLLVALATRLKQRLGATCRLARIGADVFGIAGPDQDVRPEVLFGLMEAPFDVGDHRLPSTASIGFSRLLGAGASGILALKHANIALNRAKKSLHAYHEYFLPEMEEGTRERLQIISRLREDFGAGRLEVYYQPQMRLSDGSVVGIEALLRWPDGNGGFVQPPGVFVPLAEYSGLIIDIGYWVLEQACAALRSLAAVPGAPHRVAVNVSMPQFRRPDFLQRVAAVLAAGGMPASALELEITESIAMDEPKIVQSVMQGLRAQGIRISVDDFGTGFSSLGQLRALPIDAIKIDQSFVREIAGGRGGMFAETIVALGKRLGVETIAEGVETDEQAGFLRGLGCDEAQGYLYAKPMPLPKVADWLAKRADDVS